MDPKRFTRRLIALGAAMFLCALVFVVTLFDAQIVNGDDYLDKSIRTNAKTETVKASRGILTDRNGKVLVSNRAVYTLNFDSSLVSSDELNDALLRVIELMNAQGVEIKDALPLARTSPYAYDTANGSAKTLIKYLVSLKWINEKNVGDDGLPTTLTGSALYLKLRSEYGIDETLPNSTVRTLIGLRYSLASAKMNGSTTFEFASDVDVSLISLIKDGNYAGVQVDTSSVRVYETDYAAHVLGYTGSIQDWDDYKDKDGYTLASTVGISGVENAFEDYLHGNAGKRLVTFDNDSGKITGELYSVEPKPGSTVALTIDIDFQAQVEEALKNTVSSMTKSDGIDRGAAVAVVQVGTGDVLALASYPTYSLSTFRQDLAELSTDPLQPMWNRATQGKYAPGSTLKPLTAIAALESGATTVREKIYDSGKWTYPGYSASYTYCWKRSGHGSLNVRGAIMNSCNYFFAEMGYRMGMDTLREYYAKFGLGSPTGIEIGDTAGRLPSQNEGENLAPWAAFGQANQEYSPLQLANYIATLCGGGDRYATHLLKNVRSSGSGALEYVYDAEPAETIAMSSKISPPSSPVCTTSRLTARCRSISRTVSSTPRPRPVRSRPATRRTTTARSSASPPTTIRRSPSPSSSKRAAPAQRWPPPPCRCSTLTSPTRPRPPRSRAKIHCWVKRAVSARFCLFQLLYLAERNVLCQLNGLIRAIYSSNLPLARCPAAPISRSAFAPSAARRSRAVSCLLTASLPTNGRRWSLLPRRRTATSSIAASSPRRMTWSSSGTTSASRGRTAARAATAKTAFARGTRSSPGSSRSTTTHTKRPRGSAAA